MASPAVICQFNKFGHCKFGLNCRQEHVNDICDEDSCDASDCLKRHPRPCKYFDLYRRCKFLDFCSFSHRNVENQHGHDFTLDISNLDLKIEDIIVKQREDSSGIALKIENLERENNLLKNKLENIMNSMNKITESTVKAATESALEMMIKQQKDLEKVTNDRLDTLSQEIVSLVNILRPQTLTRPNIDNVNYLSKNEAKQVPPSKPHSSSVSPKCCHVCDQSFRSKRALTEHLKTYHD